MNTSNEPHIDQPVINNQKITSRTYQIIIFILLLLLAALLLRSDSCPSTQSAPVTPDTEVPEAYYNPGGPTGNASDRRLKSNIEFIRTLDSGINLYSFQYLNSDQTFVGVIAQEVLKHPEFSEAVSINNGFLFVNYDKLNIQIDNPTLMNKAGNSAVKYAQSSI
jgi:hypothetical protein